MNNKADKYKDISFIFDMDGTLVLTEPIHFKAFKETFAKVGIKIAKKAFLMRFAGTGSKHIFGTLFKENKIKEDPNKYIISKKKLFQKYIHETTIKTVPYVKGFIKKVEKLNINRAIASGTNKENVALVTKQAEISHHFKVKCSTQEVKRPKPYPDLFLYAAKKIKADPKNTVVFEDARSGVLAAKKAGMKCIAITTTLNKKELKELGADYVIDDFKGLTPEKVLKKINI